MARRVDYEPMTFRNMREHGMTRLDVLATVRSRGSSLAKRNGPPGGGG
jgi:hypothetical protein